MTRSMYDEANACDEVLELLRLYGAARVREVLTISALLHEARDRVRDVAVAKSIRIVVVGVVDEVLVNRTHIVLLVAALLRDAIARAPSGGRVAVTGQEIERELVFAVYDTGTSAPPRDYLEDLAFEAARTVGGRVWAAHPTEGHLTLFSFPLYCDGN